MNIQNQELEILTLLRQDSRKRLTEISKKTGVPVSTIFTRLKSFNGTIIKRFTCMINYEMLGYNLILKMLIKVNPKDRGAVSDYLSRVPSINSVYKISNDYDFIIEGIFRNLGDAESFIEDLDTRHRIRKNMVFYVVDKVKEEGFMTNELVLQ